MLRRSELIRNSSPISPRSQTSAKSKKWICRQMSSFAWRMRSIPSHHKPGAHLLSAPQSRAMLPACTRFCARNGLFQSSARSKRRNDGSCLRPLTCVWYSAAASRGSMVRTRNILRLALAEERRQCRSRAVNLGLRSGSPTPPDSRQDRSQPDRESYPTQPY
jgi:hypothetical protein